MVAQFLCKQCKLSVQTLCGFYHHVKTHRNLANFRFGCGIPTCPCSFHTLSALKSHMRRKHSQTKTVKVSSRPGQMNALICQVVGCWHTSHNYSSLCDHVKWHIRDGKKITCPFPNCEKRFYVKSSFTSHISRKHKESLKNPVQVHNDVSDCRHDSDTEDTHDTFMHLQDDACCNSGDKTFLTNLALFYLRMQAQMLLPATTIQCLIDEFQVVHDSNMQHIFSKLRDELTKLNIPLIDIDNIITGLNKNNLLRLYNEGVFRSDETRKTYFKKEFNYVAPNKVYLGKNSKGKDCFLQYVPVKETLRALLSHESVKSQYTAAKAHRSDDPHLLEDVRDGRNFKDKDFFQQCMASVSIILYQDSFEVVNPLGSGKKSTSNLPFT